MCNAELDAMMKAVDKATNAEARQKAVTAFEEALAREIVRLDGKAEEYDDRLKEAKKVFLKYSTRKIIPVGNKVVEIKSAETYAKPTAEKAVAEFGVTDLLKAKALQVSASEPVRTALSMIDEEAVAELFPQKDPVPSVTVRNI